MPCFIRLFYFFVVCRDIHDNKVVINEVKSSTEVKDVYLHDASIQYLLEYCKLDTLAMVKILEKLKECVR